jgi:muconolactone delta-isomerase
VKFLVLWSLNLQVGIRAGLPEVAKMLSDLRDYAKKLHEEGKLEHYYHVVGRHGGAWIFNVESNEELEILLAKMPVYNFSTYEIHPLSEMKPPY